MGSQATRDADGILYTRAGLEIGVAATKTHVAQIAAIQLLALYLAQVRKTMDPDEIDEIAAELKSIPELMRDYLKSESSAYEIAKRYYQQPFFLYLGRGVGLPVCLEGALKLKEISYIPTEAYAAGEMKHGPIALLDKGSPVVVVANDGHVYEKVVSNIEEVRARDASVIAVATEGNERIKSLSEDIMYIPRTSEMLSPLLSVVPLQLLAYYIARLKGLQRRPAAQSGQDGDGGIRMLIGIDIIENDRFAGALSRRPRLAERVFTAAEREYCLSRPNPVQHFAARFAAKEAVGKALGTGVASWQEIEIGSGGKPQVRMTGGTGRLAKEIGRRIYQYL